MSLLVHAGVVRSCSSHRPTLLPERAATPESEIVARDAGEETQAPRFVFVQPRLDTPAPKPPERAEMSDIDRQARATERTRWVIDNPLRTRVATPPSASRRATTTTLRGKTTSKTRLPGGAAGR
ncbi:MAG: hypothetical protein R2712_06620 [Vicinamibacterales bacterium]